MEMVLPRVLVTPAVQDHALMIARSYLPGLWEPTRIRAQLDILAAQQQALCQALAQSQQETQNNSMDVLPPVRIGAAYMQSAGQCTSSHFLQDFPGTKTGGRLGHMDW